MRASRVHGGRICTVLLLIAGVFGSMTGCVKPASNGSQPNGGTPTADGGTSTTAVVQVRFGETTPVEKILSYELTVNQVTLTSASATTTDLLTSSMVIEQTNLAATAKPIASATITTDTYSKATIALGASKVVFTDNVGHIHEQTFPSIGNIDFNFNPAMMLGDGNSVLTVSLDLSQTVSLDAINGLVSLNAPVFSITKNTIGAGQQTPDNGLFQCVFGKVTAATGSTITVTDSLTGVSLDFVTDNNTVFANTSLGTAQGMLVEVEGSTQADGSLLADEVEAFQSSSGVVVSGIVSGYSNAGMVVTSQTILSDGLSNSKLGTLINVDLSQPATYSADTSRMDMTGLEYLVFNQETMTPSQFVTFSSHTGLLADSEGTAGLIVPDTIELEPQTITGTVTNYTPGGQGAPTTFDLELPSSGTSMLSALPPGASSVPVVIQSKTDLSSLPAGLSEGMTVRVHGLLFYVWPLKQNRSKPNYAEGMDTQDYQLVAQRIIQ